MLIRINKKNEHDMNEPIYNFIYTNLYTYIYITLYIQKVVLSYFICFKKK